MEQLGETVSSLVGLGVCSSRLVLDRDSPMRLVPGGGGLMAAWISVCAVLSGLAPGMQSICDRKYRNDKIFVGVSHYA